jgi:hypothetical protein
MRLVSLGALSAPEIRVIFFKIPLGASNIRGLFC